MTKRNESARQSKQSRDQARNQARDQGTAATPPATSPVTPPAPSQTLAGLFIIATPIGNMEDITLRALETLRRADVIACEDTRITARLAQRHTIKTPLFSYHDHNAERVRPALMRRLKNGESVALVSDAGTPLISDPGFGLVRACIKAGVPVTTLPGASSVLAALTLSGLPTDRFLFSGFLPSRTAGRRKTLAGLADVAATLVIMESAKRLAASLADMAQVLGPRDAAVLREMTKMYEEARHGTLPDLARHYAEAGAPKGEVTIVIAPPPEKAPLSDDALDQAIMDALKTLSVRDAAARVAEDTGTAKRRIYARALELKDGGA